MTDNAHLQMKIEQVKDDLGVVEYRTQELQTQMTKFNQLVDEIRDDLKKLKELLQ